MAVWVALGKAVLDSVCPRKGERRWWGCSGLSLGECPESPVPCKWRTPRLCCSCPGAELRAVRQEGWSPGEADKFLGPLGILAVV